MFIDFIPLSLAYNLLAHVIQFGLCISDMHACIMYMSSVYTTALHGRLDDINLACTRRLARVQNENMSYRALAAHVFCQV